MGAVQDRAGLFVFSGLQEELLQVHLAPYAARDLHEQGEGRAFVLEYQHPGPVGAELALAVPFPQRGDNRLQRQPADGNLQRQLRHVQQQPEQSLVEHVPAHNVRQLVRDNPEQFRF